MIVFFLMSFIKLINFLLLLWSEIELGEEDLNTAFTFILLLILICPLGCSIYGRWDRTLLKPKVERV